MPNPTPSATSLKINFQILDFDTYSVKYNYFFQDLPEFKRNEMNADLASQFFQSYKKRYNRARVMMGKRSPFVRWYMNRIAKKDFYKTAEDNLKIICNTDDLDKFSVEEILRCLYFYTM